MDDATIRKLRSLFRNQPVTLAYLFGSTAKGATGPLSDVDIAVLLPRGHDLTLNLRLRLLDRLVNILGRDVDLVILNEADPSLRYEVIRHGKLLYCRDESDRVAFEERTLDEYLDMGRIEEEYLKCLLQDVR